MPRTKNVGETATGETATIERVDAPVIAPVNVFNVITTFKIRTKEGDRVTYRFSGSSPDPVKALDLVCEEPEENRGKALPKNNNIMMTTTLIYGDYRFSRNLAPHVARDIFDNKNVKLFFSLMLSKELKDQLLNV